MVNKPPKTKGGQINPSCQWAIVCDIVYDIVFDIILHIVYDAVCTYIVYYMQYNIVYYVTYDVVCFCPSSLEALKMARACLSWWTMHFSLHFYLFTQKLHDFILVFCSCTWRSCMCRTATHPIRSEVSFQSVIGQWNTRDFDIVASL
jgi:hypothetical protein